MTKDEKLKELEMRQRELADEIKALREEPDEPEFKKGSFYKLRMTDETVFCTGEGRYKNAFSGYMVGSSFEERDDWIQLSFIEVIPFWHEPWKLKNPDNIDFNKPEHDVKEIPHRWFCEAWDDGDLIRGCNFFDRNNGCMFYGDGNPDGGAWAHYRMIPAEQWPQWARVAWEELK